YVAPDGRECERGRAALGRRDAWGRSGGGPACGLGWVDGGLRARSRAIGGCCRDGLRAAPRTTGCRRVARFGRRAQRGEQLRASPEEVPADPEAVRAG